MTERRKALLETTALPNLMIGRQVQTAVEETRDEYQIAYENLSPLEQRELRTYLPSLQKELFLRRSAFSQIPAEKHIELKEIVLTFPYTASPAVQGLLLYTFSQEIERIVSEHNKIAARIAVFGRDATTIH